MQVALKVVNEKVREFGLPAYTTEGSAGLDLRACIDVTRTIQANEVVLVPTGFAMHLSHPGYAAMLLPRSGLGHKHGMILGNSTGLIDSDYQGEIMVSLWNRSNVAFELEPGMRMAQMVIVPVAQVQFQEVSHFDETDRGEGGFGSSGVA